MRTRWQCSVAAVAPKTTEQQGAGPAARCGRLDRSSMAARGDHAGRGHVRDGGWPRGDRAHGANHPEAVSCTNFKALVKTKLMILEPSHLHHAQESILGYPKELKHSTNL